MHRSPTPQRAAGMLLLAATAFVTPASAQISEQTFRSGKTGDLATLCAASEADLADTAARAWCQGFIVATGQYHNAIATADPRRGRLYCLPDTGITLDQIRVAFVNWARSHPEEAGTRAVDGLMRFASATWPCPTSASRARR